MKKLVNSMLSGLGVKMVRARPMRDPVALLLLKSRELGVATMLDIGANVGMFVQTIRAAGFQGKVVSFEPTSEAHGILMANAARDPLWEVAPRMALGSVTGEAEIGISANSVSSSLLQVEEGSTQVLAETAFRGKEAVSISRLDDIIQADWRGPYAMKIDTQGYEMEVLRGAAATLAQTRVLTIELTLGQLYRNGARISDVFAFLEDAGFRAIAITEGFSDTVRNEMLQVDAVFIRSSKDEHAN